MGDEWILIAMFWIFWPVACGVLADRKGRDVVGWVMGGIIGGVFALGILALTTNKKAGTH